MNINSVDEKYPYSPRVASANPVNAPCLSQRRSIWIWLTRLAVAAGIVVLLGLIAIGVTAYRAARQAWAVTELEPIGVSISYWHQPPDKQDSLPEALRERFGDRWWSDVREVSHDPFFFGRRDDLTAENVGAICRAGRAFPRLRSFNINSDCFSADMMGGWPQLNRIEQLQIGSARLSDADLAIVGTMSALKTLRIGGASISSKGLNQLARLAHLETLTLSQIRWNRSIEQPISSGFSALKSLNVDRSPDLDDAAIACFGTAPNLEDVNFNQTPIGDQSLGQLLRSGKVRSLIISKGRISDAGLAVLANYPAPKWLVLSRMALTDKGLAALAGKEFPTLILDHSLITDEGFRALTKIKGLDFVSLDNSKISGTGVKFLEGDQPLRHLSLTGNMLTQEGIAELAKAKCSELDLSRTPIGDTELLQLAENDNLIELGITETMVTQNGVQAFRVARQARLQAAGIPDLLTLISDYSQEAEQPPDRGDQSP